MMRKCSLFLLTTSLLSWNCHATENENDEVINDEVINELLAMDIEQLLEVPIETASGIEQTLRDAPAAMVVITQEDIQRRGYTHLGELLMDLPGFDVRQIGSPQHVSAYQRGYRTPMMQRTLLMINGIVDNHLWSHGSQLSRQYPLSAFKRVEVLYGPTSAVYGPNAFLGIINLITEDGSSLKNKEIRTDISLQLGSYNSRGAEATLQGRHGDWQFNFSARVFRSDEAKLDDLAPWGFLTEEKLNNRDAWGTVLDLDHEGTRYGEYFDPTEDWGILGEVRFRDFTFGVIAWDAHESYGPYYAADRVQPNAYLNNNAQQFYLNHDYHFNDELTITSQLLYHANRVWGNWIEAVPDQEPGKQAYSYLSISDWNSLNHSWLFKQDYDYQVAENWRITAGLKYETKELTKAYDTCSYWNDTLCSSGNLDTGRYGLGPGVFYSTDPTAVIAPGTLDTMPEINLAHPHDIGTYIQILWNQNKWRWLAGIRYDRNSIYGSAVSPRLSAIYHWSPKTTFKLLYGKAFQEPSPLNLWGGWSGRTGNPDLRPEKAQNLEFILMHQQNHWLHDLSLFTARYSDVIKEEAANAGNRDIWGVEYRGRFDYPNWFLTQAPNLTGYLYYTYTQADSSITYDQTARAWLEQTSELGDIAPHKINLGIDVPFDQHWHVNLRANYVSAITLYSRNPLRAEGKQADDRTVWNLTLGYRQKPLALNFTVQNLLNEEYYYPGGEQADSGDNFAERSSGFRNSLIPATKRSFWLILRTIFN
jgi:iron complex outermembrane receptor protein